MDCGNGCGMKRLADVFVGFAGTPSTDYGYTKATNTWIDVPGRRTDATHLEVQIVSWATPAGAGHLTIGDAQQGPTAAGGSIFLDVQAAANATAGQTYRIDVREVKGVLKVRATADVGVLFHWTKQG